MAIRLCPTEFGGGLARDVCLRVSPGAVVHLLLSRTLLPRLSTDTTISV
jgi:hypothetical protein